MRLLFLSMIGWLILPVTLLAVTEQQLKAAYLYNITKYVTWPEKSFLSQQTPINLCIVGKDPFKESLKPIKKRSIFGRKFQINYYQNAAQLNGCHIAYIASQNPPVVSKELKLLKGRHILTVSDIYNFAQKGGMVELRKEHNKIKLHVNLDALQNADLFISSKLLELSHIINRHER